jgi:formate hydrogenlyase subunit 3/multisubunit Na+/H+ antiporter MnhD subunit
MLIAFIIFWIVVALAVFFVAVRGGSRAAGESAGPESKLAQRAVTVGVIVVFAFGLAIPALVLASNAEHKASVAVGGVRLNSQDASSATRSQRSRPSGASVPTLTYAWAMTSLQRKDARHWC